MAQNPPVHPIQIGFLLIDGFSMMAYAAIAEPFRAANELSGDTLYRWILISDDGEPVRASSGARLAVDACMESGLDLDMLFVCAAGNPAKYRTRATLAWLRGLAARGVRLGGVSGGPYLLARAGLLRGYRCTIHWEHRTAFAEDFPDLAISDGLYVIDRDRMSCAGGVAGLDLAMALIEAGHGRPLATAVSDWYIRTHFRDAGAEQRHSLRERAGTANTPVLATITMMEANIETPLERADLAARQGLSLRQLERLFATHLGRSIAEEYRAIRLRRARALVRQTGLSLAEVAAATGFASCSHFSRAFRSAFAMTATECRKNEDHKPRGEPQAGSASARRAAARR